jgi:hypothetical protein
MISDERLVNIEKMVCDHLNDDSAPAKVHMPNGEVNPCSLNFVFCFTREGLQASMPECMQSR